MYCSSGVLVSATSDVALKFPRGHSRLEDKIAMGITSPFFVTIEADEWHGNFSAIFDVRKLHRPIIKLVSSIPVVVLIVSEII